ncbi:lipase [Russula aff. rugulosa BPL654]|nr:lipase [Russula aff. rugulosa BPL654]
MLLRSTILTTLVGLASAVGFPRDSGPYSTLSQDEMDSTDVYANYAAAVKCGPQNITNWDCQGKDELYEAGGDGAKVQFWMVGFDPVLNSLIVAHQGTDKKKLFADLTDLDVLRTKLDPFIFPNIPDNIEVHKGFADEHAKTATLVLQAVQSLLQMHTTAMVTVVGHSLGAALALLDGLQLRLALPSTTDVIVHGYGMPRVGDQDFATFVDDTLPDSVTRINNKLDGIPIVPAMSIGFHHVLGEIHIQEIGGEWIRCPFEDNPDPRCIVGAVPNIHQANLSDHDGPYNRIMLNCHS